MDNTLFIEEQAGVSRESARIAHQHIVTGLTMAGHRVESKESYGSSYEGGNRIEHLCIVVKYEMINKDKYGNEI
jgi:hypothetical protein